MLLGIDFLLLWTTVSLTPKTSLTDILFPEWIICYMNQEDKVHDHPWLEGWLPSNCGTTNRQRQNCIYLPSRNLPLHENAIRFTKRAIDVPTSNRPFPIRTTRFKPSCIPGWFDHHVWLLPIATATLKTGFRPTTPFQTMSQSFYIPYMSFCTLPRTYDNANWSYPEPRQNRCHVQYSPTD